jgi:RimJ/RimL family protein N-acetyltransferase
MIDPDLGWTTERLDVEPLVVAHATELVGALDDPALHEFIGGRPLRERELAAQYARWEQRRSTDGTEVWGNWVLRVRATARAAGTVQATLPAAGPGAGPAEVAWVVAGFAQGQGFAREAATSLVERLRDDGWTVTAHVHPAHLASQAVARAAGLRPTAAEVDGETEWRVDAERP